MSSDSNGKDVFSDLFARLGVQQPEPGELTLKRQIELQKEMIVALARRVTELEDTVEKLKTNNNKTVPHVRNLTTRVKRLEENR